MRAADEDLARAERHLAAAAFLMTGGFADVAAREAYMAAFHAAQGYLLSVAGRWYKSHRGVIGEFGRVGGGDPAIPRELLAVLPQGFEAKAVADYGGNARIDAEAALASARRFVAVVQDANARFTALDTGSLGLLFEACWSIDSSGQWTEQNPACGQCNVTALVAEEILGGDLLRTMAPGGWHYYNRVAGHRLDFTASQFTAPIRYEDHEALRRDALADTSEAQYRAFRDAVVRRVIRGSDAPHPVARPGPRA